MTVVLITPAIHFTGLLKPTKLRILFLDFYVLLKLRPESFFVNYITPMSYDRDSY